MAVKQDNDKETYKTANLPNVASDNEFDFLSSIKLIQLKALYCYNVHRFRNIFIFFLFLHNLRNEYKY